MPRTLWIAKAGVVCRNIGLSSPALPALSGTCAARGESLHGQRTFGIDGRHSVGEQRLNPGSRQLDRHRIRLLHQRSLSLPLAVNVHDTLSR